MPRITTGKWFGPPARALAPLGVAALTVCLLCVGYHRERWRMALAPHGQARTRAGEGLVIRCDGHGYYAWLRSPLIDGDVSFDNEFDRHNPLGDWVPPARPRTPCGLRPNPWSVGPACAWSLAVVPGHLLLRALQGVGCPVTTQGYELPYQILVGATTVLAGLLGLVFLYGICRHYARPGRAALAAACLTLGTTQVFYAAIEVSMAHGLATAAAAGLVCYWLKTYGSERPGRWLVVGVLLGVTALMRWQLVTFGLLPFGECCLACRRARGNRPGHFPGKPPAGLALAAGGAAFAFLPQLFAWRAVYGTWLAAPLATAHNWLAPAWGRVLFASDRGLFYWTPLTALALAGFLAFRVRAAPGEPSLPPAGNREAAGLLAAAFFLQVYLVASLWGESVYLGVAFGFRHLTEATVALAPGLALLLERARGRWLVGLCGLACFLVLWNLLLIAQYRYGLIPAAAGADPGTLLANVPRLVRRKKALLLGQVVAAPLLLWLLRGRPAPAGRPAEAL